MMLGHERAYNVLGKGGGCGARLGKQLIIRHIHWWCSGGLVSRSNLEVPDLRSLMSSSVLLLLTARTGPVRGDLVMFVYVGHR